MLHFHYTFFKTVDAARKHIQTCPMAGLLCLQLQKFCRASYLNICYQHLMCTSMNTFKQSAI